MTLLLVACSDSGGGPAAGGQDAGADAPSTGEPDRLDALRDTATGPLLVRQSNGRVRTIRGRIPIAAGGDAESRARSFVDAWSDLFGLSNAATELGLVGIQTEETGKEIVVFERRVGAWPVFGSDLRVHILPNDQISFVFANLPADVAVAESPGIDEGEAFARAIASFGAAEEDVELISTELVVLNPGVLQSRETGSHLVWMVSFRMPETLNDPVAFVDAADGQLRYAFNTVQSARDRMIFDAINGKNRSNILSGERDLWFNEAGQDPLAEPSEEGQLAYDYALRVHDYWLQTFGRDSYDGRGATIETYVHFHERSTNAYWVQNAMWFMDGMVALDIFGHEFAHGVISRTAGQLNAAGVRRGLAYRGESGALNEHFADFFGVMLDSDDWFVGEEVAPGFGELFDVSDLEAFRSLADPAGSTGWCGSLCNQLAQPDHTDDMERLQVGGACTVPSQCGDVTTCLDDDGDCISGCVQWACQAGGCREVPNNCNDDGHVHGNSGIPNHAAYLMIEPGVDTELRHEDGIGSIKAEQIFYLALSGGFLASTADFDDFRDALVEACLEYVTFLPTVGVESYGITRTDCGVVINALHAVGIGASDTDFDAVDDGDDMDNCRMDFNPDQENQDGDELGDACDEAGGRVEGLVEVGTQGNYVPLTNAPVRLSTSQGALVGSTTTGTDGLFAFEGVAAGEHVVEVQPAGLEPQSQSVTVAVGETVQVNFRFEQDARPYGLRGEVFIDDLNDPIAGATVTVLELDGTVVGSAVTDETGAYPLISVPGRRQYIERVEAEGFATGYVRETIGLAEQTRSWWLFFLNDGCASDLSIFDVVAGSTRTTNYAVFGDEGTTEHAGSPVNDWGAAILCVSGGATTPSFSWDLEGYSALTGEDSVRSLSLTQWQDGTMDQEILFSVGGAPLPQPFRYGNTEGDWTTFVADAPPLRSAPYYYTLRVHSLATLTFSLR